MNQVPDLLLSIIFAFIQCLCVRENSQRSLKTLYSLQPPNNNADVELIVKTVKAYLEGVGLEIIRM